MENEQHCHQYGGTSLIWLQVMRRVLIVLILTACILSIFAVATEDNRLHASAAIVGIITLFVLVAVFILDRRAKRQRLG